MAEVIDLTQLDDKEPSPPPPLPPRQKKKKKRARDDEDSDDDVEAKRENCTRWLMSTETAFILCFFSEEFLRFSRDHILCEI